MHKQDKPLLSLQIDNSIEIHLDSNEQKILKLSGLKLKFDIHRINFINHNFTWYSESEHYGYVCGEKKIS